MKSIKDLAGYCREIRLKIEQPDIGGAFKILQEMIDLIGDSNYQFQKTQLEFRYNNYKISRTKWTFRKQRWKYGTKRNHSQFTAISAKYRCSINAEGKS